MRQVPIIHKKLKTLFSVILFDQTSFSILFPSILTFIFFDKSSALFAADASHATRSLWYGVCIALSFISSVTVGPLLSLVSDNFGRRKVLLIGACGAFLFAIFATIGILSGTLAFVLLGAVMQGLCWGTNPVAQATVADVTTPAEKVVQMGYLQFIISIGAFAGPIIAGYFAKSFFFNKINFALPCMIAAVFAAIAILRAFFSFKETHTTTTNALFQFKGIKALLTNPVILQLSLVLLLIQLSWSTFYQFMPPVLQGEFNFKPFSIGLFVGLIAFWLAVAATGGVQLLNRIYNHQQMIFCAVCSMVVGFGLAIVALEFPAWFLSKGLLWAAGCLIAMGDVVAYCAITALYSNAVSVHDQGKVMGLCFAIVSIAWAVTGLLGGALAALHFSLPILLAPIGVVILLMRRNLCCYV